MKRLFNEISQEEKNRILEMHLGKKNVISEQPEHGMGNNINQPTQTDSNGKIHGMGALKPSEKFPLNMRSNILNDFARFLKNCEK